MYGSQFPETTALASSSFSYGEGRVSRWLNADPFGLAGGINLYQYAGSNPISRVDPIGLLTLLIPGTQFTHSSTPYFDASFVAAVGKTFGETPQVWNWNGEDNDQARNAAGLKLALFLNGYRKQHPCEPINIVAHSHGGNVAFEASKYGNINELVTLGTPIGLHTPETANIGLLINVYSTKDEVQSHGGNEHSFFGQEYGSAGRTLPENGTILDVEVQTQGNGIESHSELHTPGVWGQVFR